MEHLHSCQFINSAPLQIVHWPLIHLAIRSTLTLAKPDVGLSGWELPPKLPILKFDWLLSAFPPRHPKVS